MRNRLLSFLTLSVLTLAGPALASDPPKDAAKEKKPDVAADISKPHADARKNTFETNEGTWMSVDVSPDGQTLASS